MSQGDFVFIRIQNWNIPFPSQEAPDKLSKACYSKIVDAQEIPSKPCALTTARKSQLPVKVLYQDTLLDGKIYDYKDTSIILANNIFDYIFSEYGIAINEQLLIDYRGKGQTYKIYNYNACSTYFDNGIYNLSANNILGVKNIFGPENLTKNTETINVSVSPEFIYPPNSLNIPEISFTIIDNFIEFPTGSYTVNIFKLPITSPKPIFTTSVVLSTLGTTTLVVPGPINFGSNISEFLVQLIKPSEYTKDIEDAKDAEDTDDTDDTDDIVCYVFNVINNINVALPSANISPTLVPSPNIPTNYTLTLESGRSVTQFPAGTYDITFTSSIPNGQILYTQVILDPSQAPADVLVVPNVNLTDISNYFVSGFYIGSTTEAAFQVVDEVTVNCFLKGTKILCGIENINGNIDEIYIAIEKIKSGTLVKTLNNGFIPCKYNVESTLLNNHNYPNMHKLYKLEKREYPELFEDLIVTGGHPILVDYLSVQESFDTLKIWPECKMNGNKYRLLTYVNKKASVFCKSGVFKVYDIVLENNDINSNYGIYANGLLTESLEEIYYSQNKSKFKLINFE